MIQKPSSCAGCTFYSKPYGKPTGFVPADGTGENGVLVVLEAPGESEEQMGRSTVGKAGHFLWHNLKRIGIDREGFRIHNVLSCTPPENKLRGMWYMQEVIVKCSPNLDRTIEEHVAATRQRRLTPVILTLGKLAFHRVMGKEFNERQEKYDYFGYPHWNGVYNAWVIGTEHPSDLMRGQTHLLPVLQFAFQRALEIAKDGLILDTHNYLQDPPIAKFGDWVEKYEADLAANPDGVFLSYDIETPHKKGSDEGELEKDESDYTILRCSFSYKPNDSVSVVWNAEYKALLERIFASPGAKLGWNSNAYDDPRIIAQMPINGARYDAMQMWHVLNSALPKGLGFVTPYYVPTTGMWKHMSDAEPAFYNAKDADMALRNFLGIKADFEKNGLWEVYTSHVARVHLVFNYMGEQGVGFDLTARKEAEDRVAAELHAIQARMESAVPVDVKALKILKKLPKDLKDATDADLFMAGYERATAPVKGKFCPNCQAEGVSAAHFKSIGKKRLKLNELENPCFGYKSEKHEVLRSFWAKRLPFKVSKKSLHIYQKALRHKAVRDRKKGKDTFDEKAILKLAKTYPTDKLYPLIIEFRGLQKLLGTYIGVTQASGRIKGGLPVGRDGRIHTLFTSNPSTLRSASQNPNLQNIPRPKGPNDPSSLIRNLFVAGEGHVLLARDYSGIEAKLVGYFAGAPDYMRLCAIDVHSFYTAHALHSLDGRVSSSELPQLSWDDNQLRLCLAEIKSRFKAERNNLYKHLVHAINFGQTASGAQEKILQETGIAFPIKTIQYVMDLYLELFPEIDTWHSSVLLMAEKEGYLRNPFGYIHRFTRPFEYYKDEDSKWQRKQGPDSNKCWAFLPQSTAAGIIKEAMVRLYENRFEEAGQYLRLLIHDELFLEVPESQVDEIEAVLTEEMERPIQAMPLQPSWNQGEYLIVGTEGKRGKQWGKMK
jgi:uracil-DNA glycosylase family 4